MNEKAALLGIGAGLALIYGAIFMGQGWSTFFDPASFIIVLGGTFSAILVNYTLTEVGEIPGLLSDFLAFSKPDLEEIIDRISRFSRTARREGLLALDGELQDLDDQFTRVGLEMAIDGLEVAEIEEMLNLRMNEELAQSQLGGRIFTSAGTYAPAFGMMGTLIGLIQMLQNLDDPTQIGQGMSTALVTTFYGALLANLIFLPLASKMRNQVRVKRRVRELTRTGVLGIVQGESPTLLERKLRLFLAETAEEDEDTDEETEPLGRAA